MHHEWLFNFLYTYRAKTKAIFQGGSSHIFDFYMLEDQKFDQFYLFQNTWREFLLLNFFKEESKILNLLQFGQLPNKIIYREIEEIPGITLGDFIDSQLQSKSRSVLEESKDESNSLENCTTESFVGGFSTWKPTVLTEYQVIDIAISIIDLLEVLHSNKIVHSNLSPNSIFLANRNIEDMRFLGLYHCSWQTSVTLNNENIHQEYEDNISIFDTRTRDTDYISPEQVVLGNELADLAY